MPIYSPTGFLDITNATLRTSNTECQNLKIGTGNLYVTSEISPSFELNLSNVTSLGATSPHTLTLSNVTTAIDATSNIITSGNLKIGGLIYTKDWGIRGVDVGNYLYVGRFTVHGITEVLITDQGASLGSTSKYTITRNINSAPLVNGIDSSSTIDYEWYYSLGSGGSEYHLWVSPSATVQMNIKVTSSTYTEVAEPTGAGVTRYPCVNGLITMSGNVVANQNLTVTANVEVGGELTVSGNATVSENLTVTGNVSDLNVVSNVNMLHTSNTASIKLNSNVVAEFPRSKKLIRYPRVALTAASGESSGYQGYYVTESSNAANDLDRTSWKAFNMTFDNDADNTWTIDEGTNYDGSNSTYNPSADNPVKNLGTGAVDGEWIKLQLPHKIRLEYMKIWLRDDDPQRIPEDWKLYGSDNNSNWTELFSKTGQGTIKENTYSVNATSMYNYLAVVVTKISVLTNYFRIVELEFFGVPEYDPEAHGTDVTVKSYPNVPNTDWLEVYYDAKDLTNISGTIADLSGKSVTGSLNGDVSIDTLNNVKSFSFDGSGDYISGTLTNTGDFDFTVSTWVFETNGITNNSVWCIGNPSSANPSPAVALGINNVGSLDLFVFGGIEIRMSNFRDTFGINKWHHIVCTRTGTTLKYFINGIDQGRPIANSIPLSIAANSVFTIGVRAGSQLGNNPMHGKIANFRLFNRALTSDEIYQLYAYQKEDFGHSTNNMTLKAGRLGIGTSEPRAALDVRGDVLIQSMISHVNGFYEEGTWVPIIYGSTSGKKTPTSTNAGWWVRVGNLVTIGGTIGWSGGDNISGMVKIGYLPYKSMNRSNYRAAMNFGVSSSGISTPSGQNVIRLVLDPGQDGIYLTVSNEYRSTNLNYDHYPTIGASGVIYGLGGTYRI
jgi:hypothetical protein